MKTGGYHFGYIQPYLLVSSVAFVTNSDSCSLEGRVCLKNSIFIPKERSWAYKSSFEFVIGVMTFMIYLSKLKEGSVIVYFFPALYGCV